MFLCFVLIIKLPVDKTFDALILFIKLLEDWKNLGWVIAGILLLLLIIIFKLVRKSHWEELKSVIKERNELQAKLTGEKLGSSDN